MTISTHKRKTFKADFIYLFLILLFLSWIQPLWPPYLSKKIEIEILFLQPSSFLQFMLTYIQVRW